MTPPRVCSRAGCTDTAQCLVVWRNPRIHDADRRKLWGACEAHAGYLRDHLAARGFPAAIEPFPHEGVGPALGTGKSAG